MTFAFLIAGACELATGLALRPAASAGWLVLTAGGAAGMLVAASLEPAGGGSSVRHTVAAVAGPGSSCGVADRGPAAGALGAMGTAAGRFGRHFRGPAWPPAVVRCGTGHRRRASRPGGASNGRTAGAMATAGSAVLLPESVSRPGASHLPPRRRHARRGPPACRAPPPAMQAPAMKAAASHGRTCRHQTGEGPRAWKTTPPGRDGPQPHAPWAAPR
jgi:hypothetical protein